MLLAAWAKGLMGVATTQQGIVTTDQLSGRCRFYLFYVSYVTFAATTPSKQFVVMSSMEGEH